MFNWETMRSIIQDLKPRTFLTTWSGDVPRAILYCTARFGDFGVPASNPKDSTYQIVRIMSSYSEFSCEITVACIQRS
jgi:hypothetical protein